MTYLTYSRGYKAPTFRTMAAGELEKVRPEIPTNVELGLKSTLFDHRLMLNLALFHVRFQDYQAQSFEPETHSFPTINAGEVRTQGIELEFRALPLQGLALNGGVTFNDATYRSFNGVQCHFGQPEGAGKNMCVRDPDTGIGITNVTGNQLAFAPRWVGSLATEYQRSISAQLDGFISANYYYRSSVNYTATHNPKTEVGAFGIFGGSIGVQTKDSRIRAALFARNLFDKRIPTFIVADVASAFYGDFKNGGDGARGGDYWQQFGETSFRTVGLSLDMKF
jgi:iron complex outermembrane receptor protein